ncbi:MULTISPECIES: hypothetical protein [Pyrobaculum]|uniref:Uncharacterized protein n=2 Tax=Pyrobaculum arsenaticum TaxID=121277 RepID=A4WI03_PYRAR|nr:hypothetical protein [Pyrobaculum arsenaticum]ABP50020.1 conserved hypothetical protein [Pyrobaculum arsenaticum DSM 13514]MCY0890213.1 hypothetical protein [Pyrobaculum arsenaticum]NYR15012.1 hypothetical protein [Pyrobaculum arsenaticum]
MSQSIQNTQTKNFEEIIKRREFLANLSASFLLAISLNPLMTLAYSPKVRELSGRGYCVEIREVDEKQSRVVNVAKAVIHLTNKEGNAYDIHAWIIRHANQTVLQPSVAVLEEGDKARFIGIGDDTEYVNGETERKDMPKEYLRLVREVALKEKKQKVARAVDIILRVYYNEEEGEQGKSSESL